MRAGYLKYREDGMTLDAALRRIIELERRVTELERSNGVCEHHYHYYPPVVAPQPQDAPLFPRVPTTAG